jgi:hypothetical protein
MQTIARQVVFTDFQFALQALYIGGGGSVESNSVLQLAPYLLVGDCTISLTHAVCGENDRCQVSHSQHRPQQKNLNHNQLIIKQPKLQPTEGKSIVNER